MAPNLADSTVYRYIQITVHSVFDCMYYMMMCGSVALSFSIITLAIATTRPYYVFYRVRSAEIDGIKYGKGGVVLVGFEDDMPVFGEITDIVTTQIQECHLILRPLACQCFDKHFHSFLVYYVHRRTLVCSSKQLHDHQIYQVRKSFTRDKLFVTAKYHIFDLGS